MASKINRKNLGRGLSALIPDADMAFLSQVARGEALDLDLPTKTNNPAKLTIAVKNKAVSVSTHKTADLESQVLPNSKKTARKTLATEADGNNHDNSTVTASKSSPVVSIDLIALDLIEANPYQPRRTFSATELEELAESVREHGLLQPIILRPLSFSAEGAHGGGATKSSGRYQLVAGERRWRAAQTAGLSEIPAIIREVSDKQALELALIENVQRHDISALDSAIAYRRLSQEFSLSQEQVAQRIGKSRSAVANTIRLLDLPIEAQQALEEGVISEGHGRAILLAPTDGARRAVLRRILRDKSSVRAAEEMARQTLDDVSKKDADEPLPKTKFSPETKRIEETLQKHLGTRVKLKSRRQGGQLLIQYFSNEELDRILKLMMR